jgi:L-asparaginase
MTRFARVEPDQDWAQIDPRPGQSVQWSELSIRLQQLFDSDQGIDGAVVVHGTNVLEETAYFLHLVLKTDKPVVVVGAQRPITALSTDGPLNLVNAVRVAADPASRGRGVMVALNEQIHCARHVTKTSTYRLETFQSPALGPMGFADADRVVFYYKPERLHTLGTPFTVDTFAKVPRVDVLYDYFGGDGGLVDAAINLGAKGLVIAGAGAGAVGGLKDALVKACAQGVVVVRSSRVGSGRVVAPDNYHFPGSVAADNLNPQKARILLQLALAITQDPAEVQRLFDTC